MGEQQTRCWSRAGQVLPKAPHCAPGTVTHSKQAATGFATHFVMVSGLITTTLVSSHQGNGAAQMLSCPHTSALVLVQLCSRPCFAGAQVSQRPCSRCPRPMPEGCLHRVPLEQGLQLTLGCWDSNQEEQWFTHDLPNPSPSSREKPLEDDGELFFHLTVG